MYAKIHYVKNPPVKPKKDRRLINYFILILIFLFTINVFANIFIYSSVAKGSILVSPLAADIIHKTVTFINSQANSINLEKIVNGAIKDEENYGIFISNLKTGERYYLNENKQFGTASLYKLWVMAVTYDQIEAGKLKLSDVLSADVDKINNEFGISSDSAELSDGVVSHTVSDALAQMITVSDNYSAYLLTNRIGISNVSEFLENNGFKNSQVGTLNSNPLSTAYDIGLFFEKLYNGRIVNKETSDKMLELLKQQKKNTKLPKFLPQDVIVAHKTGELGTFSHDAGIVYTQKGDYVIVIMSKTLDTPTADNNIGLVSKDVFDYFTK